MIRFKLKELISDYQFKEGRVLTMGEISEATGINRNTLSKIANQRGVSVVTSNVEAICRFFKCRVEDVMEFVEE